MKQGGILFRHKEKWNQGWWEGLLDSLAIQTGGPSSTPGTDRVEEENQLL